MSARPPGQAFWPILWPIVRPWRAALAATIVCVLVARTLDLAPAFLIQRVLDDHLAQGRAGGLLELGLLYLAAVVAAQLANFGAVYLTAVAAQGGLHLLRTRLLAHLHRLPMSYFDQTATGDSISRATADVEVVDTLFSTGVISLLGNLVRLVTALAAMLWLSPALSALVLLAVPPLVILTRWFQVRVRDAERLGRVAVGQLTTVLQETLVGAEVVHVYHRAAMFVARLRRALQATLDAYNYAAIYNACYSPLVTLLAAISTALVLWLGAAGDAAGWGVSIGELTAFVLLFGRFFDPITALGDDWQTVQGALAGIERIAAVLALPLEAPPAELAHTRSDPLQAGGQSAAGRGAGDGRRQPATKLFTVGGMGRGRARMYVDTWRSSAAIRARPRPISGSLNTFPATSVRQAEPVRPVPGGLAVERLTFGYTPGQPVVHEVSFTVQPGETLALVGRTGAGKSSIVQLIGGLYAPWSGWVQLAGRDPRLLASAERRHRFGVVPQQPMFFSGTLGENLALGDAQVTRAQLDRAVRQAGAADLLAALPQGYDTLLRGGPGGGMQLSAGQRQLLALARALVWDPPILLLDEATAAIDSASEARLWAALRGGAQSRAVLLVAHRLATARAADRVIVLAGGRVVEAGAPDALIRQGGHFAALAELEAAGWNWQDI